MSDGTEPTPGQSASVSGGTFHGVTVVGQGNQVHAAVGGDGAPDREELRRLVAELAERLGDPEPVDAERAVARDRAEQLVEELDGDAEPQQIGKLWNRLSLALQAVRVSIDVARIGDLVASVTGG